MIREPGASLDLRNGELLNRRPLTRVAADKQTGLGLELDRRDFDVKRDKA